MKHIEGRLPGWGACFQVRELVYGNTTKEGLEHHGNRCMNALNIRRLNYKTKVALAAAGTISLQGRTSRLYANYGGRACLRVLIVWAESRLEDQQMRNGNSFSVYLIFDYSRKGS